MWTFRPAERARQLQGQAVWVASWVVCTVLGLAMRPSPLGHATHTQLGLPPCPSVALFHRPCPGCGLTTSWTFLLHGDWAGAFHAHPFGPLLYLAYTLGAVLAIYGLVKRKQVDTNTRPMNIALVTFLVTFLAYGYWRFSTTTYSLVDSVYTMAPRRP
ncbi:MAG: DUF2752 domain-containing protein [Fimbriimonadaceae bacterium]|nr:DUF2752 domain-containing protein [Fimbriimonadaceae bacterium]